MIHTFILLLYFHSGAGGVGTWQVEFPTEQGCQDAGNAFFDEHIKDAEDDGGGFSCVEKK